MWPEQRGRWEIGTKLDPNWRLYGYVVAILDLWSFRKTLCHSLLLSLHPSLYFILKLYLYTLNMFMLYPISLIIACCPRRSGYSLELCQLWFLLSVIRRWIQDLVSISVGKVIYDYVLCYLFESFPVTRWMLELYVSANLGYVATPHFFKLHFLTLGYFFTQNKFLRVGKESFWFWISAWFLTQSRLDVLRVLVKNSICHHPVESHVQIMKHEALLPRFLDKLFSLK